MVRIVASKKEIDWWKKEYNLTEKEIRDIIRKYSKRSESEIDKRLDNLIDAYVWEKRDRYILR